MARVTWRDLTLWKKIGSNIKNVRKWRKLTDTEVSEKVGIDLKRYRRIERGQTETVILSEIVSIITFIDCLPEEIIPLGYIN